MKVDAGEVRALALWVPRWTAGTVSCSIAAPVYATHNILLCERVVDDAALAMALATSLPGSELLTAKAEGSLATRHLSYVLQILEWVRHRADRHPGQTGLLQVVVPNGGEGGVIQGLIGLLRSIQCEHPWLTTQLIGTDTDVAADVMAERLAIESGSGSCRVRYVEERREVWCLTPLEHVMTGPRSVWREDGVYLITGGMGRLAQVFARAIGFVEGTTVVLVGRRPLTAFGEDRLREFRRAGIHVAYHVVDVCEPVALSRFIATIVVRYGRLDAVIHAASVTCDGPVAGKTNARVIDVLAPKVAGLVALDEATRDIPLERLVLCSSVAGSLGIIGRPDDAAGNGFMDAYAWYRSSLVAQRRRWGRTLAIAWPSWTEADVHQDAAIEGLHAALASDASHVIVGYGDDTDTLNMIHAATVQPRGSARATGAESRELSSDDPCRKVVLITGGGRGIGRLYAHRLASEGAKVALMARSVDELAQAVASVRSAGGMAEAFVADVTDDMAVREAVAMIEDKLGPIDSLINNAGILGPMGNTWECDWRAWWRAFEVHIGGSTLVSNAVIPGMARRRQGRIVNIVSNAGAFRWPTVSAYSVSKAALIKLSENLALECKPFALSVFAYHPGFLPMGLTNEGLDLHCSSNPAEVKLASWCRGQIDAGKAASPEESADKLLRLLSGAYDVLSGRYVTVHDDLDKLVRHVESTNTFRDYLMLRVHS